MRQWLRRLVYALALLVSGCMVIVGGCAMDGKVVDSETGKPIPDALVIAEWQGDIGGPVQSSQVCFHLEVVKTDAEGRYHVPSWSRLPVADWEWGLFGLRNVSVFRRTYKAGYSQLMYDPNDTSTILMKPVQATPAERIKELSHEGTVGCGREDGSTGNELRLWTAICEEARQVPAAQQPMSFFQNESLLQLIDRHISAVTDDLHRLGPDAPVRAEKCNAP